MAKSVKTVKINIAPKNKTITKKVKIKTKQFRLSLSKKRTVLALVTFGHT